MLITLYENIHTGTHTPVIQKLDLKVKVNNTLNYAYLLQTRHSYNNHAWMLKGIMYAQCHF